MEAITLFIAVISSLLVMWLTPVKGLIVYVAALAWYPSYLTVKIGTVDFNVARIVILAIFAILVMAGGLKSSSSSLIIYCLPTIKGSALILTYLTRVRCVDGSIIFFNGIGFNLPS